MKECKVIVMGFGAVGQGVARAISLKKDMIKERFDVELKIVAAADSSSSAICADGLDEELLVNTKNEFGKLSNYPEYGSTISGLNVLDAFLKDKISFLGMSDVIEQTMGKVAYIKEPTYEDYVDTDAEARRVALSLLSS